MQPNFHSPLLKGRRPPRMRDPRLLYPIRRELPNLPPRHSRSSRPPSKKRPQKTTFFITGITTLDRAELIDILNEEYRVVSAFNRNIDYVLVGDQPGVTWNKVTG